MNVEDDLKEALAENKKLLDLLEDAIVQACYNPQKTEGAIDELDSCALSAFANAMRYLAKKGRIKILHEAGRRIIAKTINEAVP